MSPSVAVIGATGKQGGAVVDALLQQGNFKVTAVTRDPSSESAKALAARGVDIAQADLYDRESLIKAFTGAYGVFLVTDSYGSAGGDPDKEAQMGRTAVDAAEQAGVKHLVWSALEDPRPTVKDALPELSPGHIVPHFESKAEITEYLKTTGVPYTVLETSIFMDNALGVYGYRKQEDGSIGFALNAGTKAHPQCAVSDIGTSTAAVLADTATYLSKTIPVVGDHISFSDVAATLTKVTGTTVKFTPVPRDVFAGFGFPGAAELANMWQYYVDFDEFADRRPLDKTAVKCMTFQEWAEQHAGALKAALAKVE